jgi:formyltetrahydrofolate hydrolase
MDYDAANYDFYRAYADAYDPKQIILAAVRQKEDVSTQALASLMPGEIEHCIPHRASNSVSWRARMSHGQFTSVRRKLKERGMDLLATHAVPMDHGPMDVALFVTRQEQSPRAVLNWCRENPKLARVRAVISTAAKLEPLAQEFGVPFMNSPTAKRMAL